MGTIDKRGQWIKDLMGKKVTHLNGDWKLDSITETRLKLVNWESSHKLIAGNPTKLIPRGQRTRRNRGKSDEGDK